MAATEEAPLFQVTSVKPVGVWLPAGIAGPSAKCHLCLRRLVDCTGERVSGDVVVHAPCRAAMHDACLNAFFLRPVPKDTAPTACPSCKAAWQGSEAEHVNIFTGASR